MSRALDMKPELRYGHPAADQILLNRCFTVEYSYYFRQPKWALEVVDPNKQLMNNLQRSDNFRPDFRIPPRFRADLSDYEDSGYARGHMVAGANHNDTELQNSETFLLSNMCRQLQVLNGGKWKELEEAGILLWSGLQGSKIEKEKRKKRKIWVYQERVMGLFSELMGNASEVDASQLNDELGPILADNESVELGFKLIRDLFVFTNHRLIMADKQGLTGSKVEFLSIPYKSISRFAVETTGTFDADSELRIWVGSDPNPIEKELNGGADIAAIQKTLANCIFG